MTAVGQKLDESEVVIVSTSSVVASPLDDDRHESDTSDDESSDQVGGTQLVDNNDADDAVAGNNDPTIGSRSDLSNLSQVSSLSRSRSCSVSSGQSDDDDHVRPDVLLPTTASNGASILVEGITHEATDDDQLAGDIGAERSANRHTGQKDRVKSTLIAAAADEEAEEEVVLRHKSHTSTSTSVTGTIDSVFINQHLDQSECDSVSG